MAQVAYDLVAPREQKALGAGGQQQAPHQPLDVMEGVSNAYGVVSTVSLYSLVQLFEFEFEFAWRACALFFISSIRRRPRVSVAL